MPEAVGELPEHLSHATHPSFLSFCQIVLGLDFSTAVPARSLASVALCLDSPLQQLGDVGT